MATLEELEKRVKTLETIMRNVADGPKVGAEFRRMRDDIAELTTRVSEVEKKSGERPSASQ